MKNFTLLLVILLSAGCAKEGQKKLGGTWVVTSEIRNGIELFPDNHIDMELRFTEDKSDATNGTLKIIYGGSSVSEGDYTITNDDKTLISDILSGSGSKAMSFTRNKLIIEELHYQDGVTTFERIN